MPAADSCAAIGAPHGSPSPASRDTTQVSRGKLDGLRCTPAGSTRPAPLMDTGLCLAVQARPAPTAFYPVPVRQVAALHHASFRPRLAATPVRVANPSPPSGWVEDFHLQAIEHARHTRRRSRRSDLRAAHPTTAARWNRNSVGNGVGHERRADVSKRELRRHGRRRQRPRAGSPRHTALPRLDEVHRLPDSALVRAVEDADGDQVRRVGKDALGLQR